MSFSVKGGNSPTQTTPIPAPYVSPSLAPQSAWQTSPNQRATHPPPFSLGDSSAGGGASTFDMRLPDSNGQSAAGSTRRQGTDPTKYKTTICRNWEQTGSCSFRGCTFAHGVEELRAPQRTNTSPPLAPSMTTLPPPAPLAAGSSPVQNTREQQQQQQLNNSGTTFPSSSGNVTSATGNTNSGGPSAAAAATGNSGGGNNNNNNNNNTASSQPQPQQQQHLTGMGIEQLMEMLCAEIAHERSLVSVHIEANKALEGMLRKEQQVKEEAVQLCKTLKLQIEALQRQLSQKDAEISQLIEIADRNAVKVPPMASAPAMNSSNTNTTTTTATGASGNSPGGMGRSSNTPPPYNPASNPPPYFAGGGGGAQSNVSDIFANANVRRSASGGGSGPSSELLPPKPSPGTLKPVAVGDDIGLPPPPTLPSDIYSSSAPYVASSSSHHLPPNRGNTTTAGSSPSLIASSATTTSGGGAGGVQQPSQRPLAAVPLASSTILGGGGNNANTNSSATSSSNRAVERASPSTASSSSPKDLNAQGGHTRAYGSSSGGPAADEHVGFTLSSLRGESQQDNAFQEGNGESDRDATGGLTGSSSDPSPNTAAAQDHLRDLLSSLNLTTQTTY